MCDVWEIPTVSAVDRLGDSSLVGTEDTLAGMSFWCFVMVGALVVECGGGDKAWWDSVAGKWVGDEGLVMEANCFSADVLAEGEAGDGCFVKM